MLSFAHTHTHTHRWTTSKCFLSHTHTHTQVNDLISKSDGSHVWKGLMKYMGKDWKEVQKIWKKWDNSIKNHLPWKNRMEGFFFHMQLNMCLSPFSRLPLVLADAWRSPRTRLVMFFTGKIFLQGKFNVHSKHREPWAALELRPTSTLSHFNTLTH